MNTFVKNNNLLINFKSIIYPIGSNTANWWNLANWDGLTSGNLTTVGSNGGPSYYGTYDQSGLLREPLENNIGINNIYTCGGSWSANNFMRYNQLILAANRGEVNSSYGFRIASYTNPNNYSNFLPIGDLNNPAAPNGYGSVNYDYQISKYLTTYNEYLEFLQAIARVPTNTSSNTSLVYSNVLGNDAYKPNGLYRSIVSGEYNYFINDSRMLNKPINYVGWTRAARFANWLHNGKPTTGALGPTTTEDGAYDMTLTVPVRKTDAKYFIPTISEWTKAGYYKGGSTNAGYWLYATQSDVVPSPVQADSSGNGLSSTIVLGNLGINYTYPTTIANFGLNATMALGFNTGLSNKLNIFSIVLSSNDAGIGEYNAVSIYSDDNGKPGSLLFSSSGSARIASRLSRYRFAGQSLMPNTTYWVVRTPISGGYNWFFLFSSNTNEINTPIAINNSGYSFVDVMTQSGEIWSSYTPSPGFLSYRNWGASIETA